MERIAYKSFLVVLVCIYLPGSCTHRKDIDESIYNLDIRSITKQEPASLPLSNLTGAINYIPLETNSSCLLHWIDNIVVVNDYIYISDRSNLFQFGLSGNFIRQIGRIGKGPGEHGRRISFAIDDYRQEIYIFSTNIMNVYDLETGMYKRRFLISQDISGFHILPQGKAVLFTYELPAEVMVSSICEVFLVGLDGELVDSIPNYSRLNIKSNSRGYATFYEYDNNEVRYLFNYRDTLYRITKDFKRIPYTFFNLENSISRDNLFIEPVYDEIQHPDFLFISEILENTQYLFITAQKGISLMIDPDIYYVVFDKETGDIFSTPGLLNDIDGGLAFWPRYAAGAKLISHYLPTEFIDHYKSTTGKAELSEDFVALVKSLDENDNPVLVIIEH